MEEIVGGGGEGRRETGRWRRVEGDGEKEKEANAAKKHSLCHQRTTSPSRRPPSFLRSESRQRDRLRRGSAGEREDDIMSRKVGDASRWRPVFV